MIAKLSAVFVSSLLMLGSVFAAAQTDTDLLSSLKVLTETPAVSGYESDLSAKIGQQLSAFSPKLDNLGNLMVTIGAGVPHRLVVTSIDEPGFVVSGITADGYLRVQRLPQGGLSPLWNELHSAQPVLIRTHEGHLVNGAVGGLSVHLQPGRQHAPDLGDLDDVYVDVGATNAEQVPRRGLICWIPWH